MNALGIEAFLAIIETGSISKAADILHLSQSTISHRLKTLESELGFKLLDRHRGVRGITLTPRGHAFISLAQKSALLDKEIEDIRAERPKRLLKLGVADSISLFMLPKLYRQILHNFSEFQPNIVTQHTLETYDSIKSGDTDIGFVKRDFNMPNLVVEALFQEEMVLVRYGSVSNPLPPIDPSSLPAGSELFMDWGYSYQIWHDALWKDNSYKIRVDAAHLIFDLLQSEQEWTIVPRSIFEAMKKRGPFYEQPLLSEPPKRSCFLVYHRHLSNDKRSVISFIKSYFLEA